MGAGFSTLAAPVQRLGCSGSEVVRYSPEALHAEFGAGFRLLDSVPEAHRTPRGTIQAFVYRVCRVES